MKWSRSQFAPGADQRIVDRLTAIRIHVGQLRQRVRREGPIPPADLAPHLAAIDEHVDAAAAEAKALREHERG